MDIYHKPSLSVYLQHYSKPSLDECLAHHGIRGQKWGVRNGPPYPLGEKDHSASEKKAGWQKSLDKHQVDQQRSSDKSLTITKGGAKMNMSGETRNNHQSHISNGALNISNEIRQVANKTGLKLKTGNMSIDEDCKAVDPDYNPNLPGRAFPLKLLSEPWRSTDGSRLRQGGSFSPAPWLKISVHMALGFRYMQLAN